MAFDFFAQDDDGDLITNPMCNVFSTTTDSNGHWTVDITNDSLSHIYSVHATAMSSDNTPGNAATASVSAFSLTTVSGGAHKPATVGALGGSPVQSVGSGVTIYVTVIGDQA